VIESDKGSRRNNRQADRQTDRQTEGEGPSRDDTISPYKSGVDDNPIEFSHAPADVSCFGSDGKD